MSQQDLERKLAEAEQLLKITFIRAYLAEWWNDVIERREAITPSDWLNICMIQIEMLLDAQNLTVEERAKISFELVEEIQKRTSPNQASNAVN